MPPLYALKTIPASERDWLALSRRGGAPMRQRGRRTLQRGLKAAMYPHLTELFNLYRYHLRQRLPLRQQRVEIWLP